MRGFLFALLCGCVAVWLLAGLMTMFGGNSP